MWGSKRFPTHDDSRNSWWVALFTGGEGWHNNHHAHPVSVRHGLMWSTNSIRTAMSISVLEKLGLAKTVNVARSSISTIRGLLGHPKISL